MLRSHDNSLYEQFRRKDCQNNQKRQKVLVVPFGHAGANPGTVVVELFDTGAAVLAVDSSRRTVDVASVTKFQGQIVTLDDHAVVFLKVS